MSDPLHDTNDMMARALTGGDPEFDAFMEK